ncbi:hypothetical protein BSZ22_32490 [Bradyrhizobium canariense]|uniref:Uncharacterized protein n=1 Tax=Bradyrhizobium canariense TaxID=255045 RepID=A0A1X3GJ74_9BRAD|nr:hypothetical protein BSZ22_32490 [Bradyrhizobium canariense]OSI79266.1 hypothetical protein BSZ23_15895 [Bradyrhizobium canariense]OSI90761.1 hypothetical protein BSZ24_19300 [Bradyrhizobium canariense]OSI91708.1 hypothetical protein BSZ25_14790 [Bradyrhizobium canariense]OSJ03909.1 hypothetical protein BSZ18_31015 [Bradyrhizobium canariense]
MPWMSPPCYPNMSALDQPYGDPGAKREGAELALRMRRCGVSRWHPDPARECERVEGMLAVATPTGQDVRPGSECALMAPARKRLFPRR